MDGKQIIEQNFKRLSGLPAWNVSLGWGSFLTMNFGEPHLSIREPRPNAKTKPMRRRNVTPSGEHHLWIRQCEWVLETKEDGAFHSEESRERMSEAALVIDGQILIALNIAIDPPQTELIFDLGARLRLLRYSHNDEPDLEIWQLFSDDMVLTFLSNGEIVFGPGNNHIDVDPRYQIENIQLTI